MNARRQFNEFFNFCKDIREKHVSPVSAWSTTTLTPCQRSQRLRGQGVSGVVNDYADKVSA